MSSYQRGNDGYAHESSSSLRPQQRPSPERYASAPPSSSRYDSPQSSSRGPSRGPSPAHGRQGEQHYDNSRSSAPRQSRPQDDEPRRSHSHSSGSRDYDQRSARSQPPPPRRQTYDEGPPSSSSSNRRPSYDDRLQPSPSPASSRRPSYQDDASDRAMSRSSHRDSSERSSSSSREPRRHPDPSTNHLRPQQSMSSLRGGSRQSERDEYDRPPLPRLDTSFDARRPSVTQRMQQGGWMGVDSRAGSPASSTSDMDAPPLEKRDSADSGFAEPESGSYFGDWTKLKNAVWGTAETTSPSAPSEGYGWSTLVAKAVSLGAEDDAIGPDGDTKLGRCIKKYHISRAASPDDLPDWIFTATERSARATAASRTADRADEQRRRRERSDEQQDHSDRGNERRYGERSAPPPHRQFAQVAEGHSSYKTVTRRGSSQDLGTGMPSLGMRRGSATAEPGQSRAAGRLRAMTDAKRR